MKKNKGVISGTIHAPETPPHLDSDLAAHQEGRKDPQKSDHHRHYDGNLHKQKGNTPSESNDPVTQ